MSAAPQQQEEGDGHPDGIDEEAHDGVVVDHLILRTVNPNRHVRGHISIHTPFIVIELPGLKDAAYDLHVAGEERKRSVRGEDGDEIKGRGRVESIEHVPLRWLAGSRTAT